MIDYFGARMERAQKKNSEYIGKINERNRAVCAAVLSGKKDALEQKKRWLNRKWKDNDRLTALNMYQQGYGMAAIAEYLERKAASVFDELQPLIVKNALGVAGGGINPKMRAIPKETLIPLMDKEDRMYEEWLMILGTSHEFYHRLRGNRKEKDVPAAVAIKMAIFLRTPVDKLFNFGFKQGYKDAMEQ